MTDTRHKDANWEISADVNRRIEWDGVHAALLMDLRDELKLLNSFLRGYDFYDVPFILRGIKKNTAPKKRKKAAKP